MKKLILFTLLGCIQLSAQIRISSNPNLIPSDPQELTVDGSITIRDKIYVGGSDNTLGNPGKPGQLLVSQGEGLPPKWRTLNVPSIEAGFFYLIYNNAFTDYNSGGNDGPTDAGEGLDISNSNVSSNNGPYNALTARNNTIFQNFQTIDNLTKNFQVYSANNQVYITFEAMAQIASNGEGQGVEFSCGIFAGGSTPATRTLRGMRRITLQQTTNPSVFVTFTQIALADGLGIGTHTVEVACKRNANLSSYNGVLRIGRSAVDNLNNFVTKSSLKVEVYEAPSQFNDIIPN